MISRITNIQNQGDALSTSGKDKEIRDPDRIDKMIARRKELGLDLSDVISLIENTNNPEYIYKCIQREKELGLYFRDVLRLLERIKDTDYVDQYIDDWKNKGLRKYQILSILEKTANTERTRKYLGRRKEFNFDKADILTIIGKAKDIELTEECIEKREEYDFDKSDVSYLVRTTQNAEFIDRYIGRREEFGFEKGDILLLMKEIQNLDIAYIDKYIERKEEFGFNKNQVVYLLLGSNSHERIDRYIARRKEFGFEKIDIISLIVGVKNVEAAFLDKYIERREEFGFEKTDILTMIKRIQSIADLDKYIERKEEFGLENSDILNLLNSIKNIEPVYIDKYIAKREELGLGKNEIVNLIIRTKNPQYYKKCVERWQEIGLEKKERVALILLTDEYEYIKKCIEDGKKLGLESFEIASLITKTSDPDYMKECIARREELGLDKEGIGLVAINTNDEKYMKECIARREELGLDDKETLKIALEINDKEYLDSLVVDDGKEIVLPSNMTIGMEIETIGPESRRIMENGDIEGWLSMGDNSINPDDAVERGVEVVSPILKGDTKISSKQIKQICKILETLGQYVSELCGGHVHIGADYLTNVQAWKNLIELWANAEHVIYIISNKEGDISREGVSKYASPISKDIEEGINSGSVNISDEKELTDIKTKIVKAQKNRYKGINFYNIANVTNKRTVEFRLSNGTLDASTWIDNINLFGGIVRAAQDLSIIQSKEPDKRTEQENHLLQCLERIKAKNLEDKDVLEQLLEITIPEHLRDIYRRRYEVNSKLLKANPQIGKELGEFMTDRSIIISREEIGRAIYQGEDRITGQEHGVVSEALSREIAGRDERTENSLQ